MTCESDHGTAEYRSHTTQGMSWWTRESFMRDFSETYAEDPSTGTFSFVHRVVQRKSGRITFAVHGVRDGGQDIFVKQFRPKSWVERIKFCFRRTRAETEWQMNQLLRRCGLPVPLVLAWGVGRYRGLWSRGVLIMEAVQPGTRLRDYLKDHPGGGLTRRLAKRLAIHIAAMHNAGLHHRDLHGDNILIGGDQDGVPSVFFVDLHEVRRRRPMRSWMWVDDLGRLSGYVSAPLRQRLLFLNKYLEERGIDRKEWKTWARRIDARTRQIWERHYRKRGARIDTY